MHLLIDADSICYSAGYSANEPGQENLANWQLDNLLKTIISDTQCDTHQLYISGSNNFRYNIYPEYKGNRVGMVRPIHLQSMREHLIVKWGAAISDGNEADDAVGIAQMSMEDTAISHIDKDINMIPGKHYNPVKKLWYDISNEEAMHNFYIQLILGDKVDNIPGFDGKMRPKCPQFLQPTIDAIKACDEPVDMLEICLEKWSCFDVDAIIWSRVKEFNQAAHCLWIQRKEYDDWRNYLNDSIMEERGLLDGLIRSLPAPFDLPADDGPQSINV